MLQIFDPETEDMHPQASSSKAKIVDDGKSSLADFAFDKLPTELLVEIFKNARPDNVRVAYTRNHPFPLTQVCRYWRTVALDAPTLWSNIHIMNYDTEQEKAAARVNLERSKMCPLFLTWFSSLGQPNAEVQEIIHDLIIPYASRWQRITLNSDGEEAAGALLTVMGHLDFQILQDIEITHPSGKSSQPGLTLCRNAPLLRRCRLRSIHSFPPLPSNLVVLDCMSTITLGEPFNLDPVLEFLPHVAHSLEHLRFGPPTPNVSVTLRKSRITLQNLKTLLVGNSYDIMEHILTPNLTYFAALYPFKSDVQRVAEMFHCFSAPKLQSIQFHRLPLLPLLTMHNLPSMFPQLESVSFVGCTDESAFADLLEPPHPAESSLQKSAYPPKYQKVENPFPKLKELSISNIGHWTSFQAAIEKRLKNGDKSLKIIHMPKEDVAGPIMRHVTQWLPKQGIELDLHEPGELHAPTPQVFQDDFCIEESLLFMELTEESDWDDEDDEYPFYEDYDDYGDFDYLSSDIYDDGEDEEDEGDGYNYELEG